jgi:hypothetical protein
MRLVIVFATLVLSNFIASEAMAANSNDCIAVAAAYANRGPREIDGWLARYRRSYDNCVSPKNLISAKAATIKKIQPVTAVPTKQNSPARKKQAIRPAEPIADAKMLQLPEIPRSSDPGADSWLKNCSQRYGSFSKDSQFYIATSGRRMPCSMFTYAR